MRTPRHLRCWVASLAGCLLLPLWGANPRSLTAGYVDVRKPPYSAAGDSRTDDTRAFQSALDAVAAKGGGIVFVPAGAYLIKSHLTIPAGTSLVGVAQAPQLFSLQRPGSLLLAVEGAGSTEGAAFVTLEGPNSTLEGIAVYYPNQAVAEAPTPYPWTVRAGPHDNASLINVLLVNPYQAVDLAQGSSRHYIRGLYGQPLFKGIWVDKCYDIGRIRDVHFWPFWSQDKKVLSFQVANATAFIFQRTDWEVVENVFCWQYHVGIELSSSQAGAMNGQMSNVGLDAVDIGIVARDTQGPGIAFSNLSIANDDNGKDHVAIWGQDGSQGPRGGASTGKAFLYITGGSFWGYWNRVVKWENSGTAALSMSRLAPFRLNGPMIELLAGQAMIHDSTMTMYPGLKTPPKPGTAIFIAPAVEAVIVHDNQLNGHQIINQAGERAAIRDNLP